VCAPTGGGFARGGQTGGADLLAITGGEAVDDWWIWWEINKNLYLIPQRELAKAAPSRYVTPAEIDAARRAALREEVVPLLVAALQDGDAGVRAAAATALGRLGGDAAIGPLTAALSDNVLSVREAALLALGATGSIRAANVLLGVAGSGTLPDGSDSAGATARPLALVGLGLGRRHGLSDSVDVLVEQLVSDAADDPDIAVAGFLYRTLAGGAVLAGLAGTLAERKDLDLAVRCRVIEALPLDDGAHLPAVIGELKDADAERRRAAAVALAAALDGGALQRLEQAFEKEEEPLTRGFLLVSLGQLGGPDARDLLLKQLRRGRAIDRPWVALGLGLLVRAADDPKAREALREGLAEEASADARGAWLLACGLARDAEAGPALREALAESANPRLRMFAALALSMLRDDASLAALRERLDAEQAPLARAGVTLGVALYGRAEDAPRLLAELSSISNAVLQEQVASALGTHGSAPAAEGLRTLLLSGKADLPAGVRAAAFDALGLLLDPVPGFLLTQVSAARNFSVFPEWLARALTSTTL
jgi:HEAT repeat protein